MTLELLIKKLKSVYGPGFDHGLVERAYKFAEEAHHDQTRRSGDDYITHPLAVAMRLADWKLDAAAIAASLLHDVAEDSPYTKKDIEKHFGSEVAFLVGALTKLKAIHYTDAAERATENIRKMVLAFAEDIRVVLIKLADRLHNMETISFLKSEARLRISRETLEIYSPLADRLGMGELKGQLEDLAFPVVYPDAYRELRALVAEPIENRIAFVGKLIPRIRELLAEEEIRPRDVHARAKHWYSLWRKLAEHDGNIEAMYDLMAVRVIVGTIEECYRALGRIHGEWRPLPGRIKDYIALPKPNGYRSIHTTIFGPEGKITEIQIRTKEMHDEAEGGIAAHWFYSESKTEQGRSRKRAPLSRSRDITWVNQLREWQSHFQDPREFLESLKIDFFKKRIFVFTPKGEVIDLPEGATPVDFAYHIHSDIGDRASGAKVGGKMTALDSELKNGDIVEILTQKNKKPSRQWLEFVKTTIAKKHIRSALGISKTERVAGKPRHQLRRSRIRRSSSSE